MPSWWTRTMNSLQDTAMHALIGKTIIYNVSWEDPRIDCELLDLTSNDTILMLTSGGCNVLDMALEGAKKVVAADLNPRQNALLELKCVAIKHLPSHEQFFQLFAASNVELFREVYPTLLRPHLSEFAREFWDATGEKFFQNVMWGGASGFAAWLLQKIARCVGLGGLIDEARSCSTLKEQREVYAKYRGRVDAVASFLNFTKRIWCPLIAVPASQLHLFGGNIVQLAADNLFTKTHLKSDNYHYFGYLYGCYTRECCPRYLKQENWSKLKAAVNSGVVEIRTGKLHEVASLYPDGYFSRYILLDHMDWLSRKDILEEWTVFVRKARPDVRFLWRSFADVQHIAPLKYLTFHPENVKAALSMYPDRVFMYNSTHLATLNPSFTIVPRSDYKPAATLWDDANVLFHNWLHPIKGDSHQERLESFYSGQARSYDAFRHRFLHGRLPMIECMPTPSSSSSSSSKAGRGGVWVDLGGGTASNLEHFKDTTTKDGSGLLKNLFSRVYVLDLCRPLLEVAKQRVKVNGWESFVSCVEGDATNLQPLISNGSLPQPGTVDVVTMSYSLTMIPDWKKALQQARMLLKPETGYICISDFTVTPEHSWITRFMWPRIFKTDGVNLNPAHIETLSEMFEPIHLELSQGGFPYVPFLKAPFYVYVGRKTGNLISAATGGPAAEEDSVFASGVSLASKTAASKEAPKSSRKSAAAR